jgi:hypothetical protein
MKKNKMFLATLVVLTTAVSAFAEGEGHQGNIISQIIAFIFGP